MGLAEIRAQLKAIEAEKEQEEVSQATTPVTGDKPATALPAPAPKAAPTSSLDSIRAQLNAIEGAETSEAKSVQAGNIRLKPSVKAASATGERGILQHTWDYLSNPGQLDFGDLKEGGRDVLRNAYLMGPLVDLRAARHSIRY
jgi:hypothetical protein